MSRAIPLVFLRTGEAGTSSYRLRADRCKSHLTIPSPLVERQHRASEQDYCNSLFYGKRTDRSISAHLCWGLWRHSNVASTQISCPCTQLYHFCLVWLTTWCWPSNQAFLLPSFVPIPWPWKVDPSMPTVHISLLRRTAQAHSWYHLNVSCHDNHYYHHHLQSPDLNSPLLNRFLIDFT